MFYSQKKKVNSKAVLHTWSDSDACVHSLMQWLPLFKGVRVHWRETANHTWLYTYKNTCWCCRCTNQLIYSFGVKVCKRTKDWLPWASPVKSVFNPGCYLHGTNEIWVAWQTTVNKHIPLVSNWHISCLFLHNHPHITLFKPESSLIKCLLPIGLGLWRLSNSTFTFMLLKVCICSFFPFKTHSLKALEKRIIWYFIKY